MARNVLWNVRIDDNSRYRYEPAFKALGVDFTVADSVIFPGSWTAHMTPDSADWVLLDEKRFPRVMIEHGANWELLVGQAGCKTHPVRRYSFGVEAELSEAGMIYRSVVIENAAPVPLCDVLHKYVVHEVTVQSPINPSPTLIYEAWGAGNEWLEAKGIDPNDPMAYWDEPCIFPAVAAV